MWSNNYLTVLQTGGAFFLSAGDFVAVAAVFADEVSRSVNYNSAAADEEIVCIAVSHKVDGVYEDIADTGAYPVFAAFSYAQIIQADYDIAKGGIRLSVHFVDKAHSIGFFGDRLIHGGMYTADDRGDLPEAVGNISAHIQAFSAPRIIGISHTFLYSFPFQLSENDADIQHSIAHRGGGIEFFGSGNELHLISAEKLHHIGKIQNRAAYAVQFIDDNGADKA